MRELLADWLLIQIWAESGDDRATAKLAVKVIDEDEFAPQFRQTSFRFNVAGDAKAGEWGLAA